MLLLVAAAGCRQELAVWQGTDWGDKTAVGFLPAVVAVVVAVVET